jgi:hypothetical protein
VNISNPAVTVTNLVGDQLHPDQCNLVIPSNVTGTVNVTVTTTTGTI